MHEKRLYSELFWSAFSRIRTEYGEIFRISISPYHFPAFGLNTERCSVSLISPYHFPAFGLNTVYSVLMRESADQNNSEYGHFLRSVIYPHRK